MTMQSPQHAPDHQLHLTPHHVPDHQHHQHHHHVHNQRVGWSEEVWERIHAEVHHELTRARVAAKFLPTVHVYAKTLSVPADVVTLPGAQANFAPGAMTIDEGVTLRINEFWTEFVMTPAQVAHEGAEEAAMGHAQHPDPTHHPHAVPQGHTAHHVSTGITLATRAANLLAQAEDMLIMQGANALLSPLFTGSNQVTPPTLPWSISSLPTPPNGISYRGIPADLGLLNLPLGPLSKNYPQSPFSGALPPILVGTVQDQSVTRPAYQGNTVAAVAQGCSALQAIGQGGPYALVLQSVPWADTNSPLRATMILPSMAVKELVTAGFHVTGALAPWNLQTAGGGASNGLPSPSNVPSGANVLYTGVLLSLGGHPVDLVRCQLHNNHDALVTYEQTDPNGNLHFRIRQRFALRIKDITAMVPLLFLDKSL
jgi:hypothetical protein